MNDLRIALDPGHMGTPEWDRWGAKYTQDARGRYLSEGLLVLQLAYLLRDRFVARGAEVIFTRDRPGTVAGDYSKFDPIPSIENAIRTKLDEPWFLSLIEAIPPGPKLWSAVEGAKEYQAILSYPRYQYYALGPDLDERARIIREGDVDLALILHLDTNGPPSNPTGIGAKGRNSTKVYVPGAFTSAELSTRLERANFAKLALQPEIWNASVALSKSIVDRIHTQMGIRYSPVDTSITRGVLPGVHSRNLGLPRRIAGMVHAYLESLFYSDPEEFERFLDYRYEMRIDGKNYPYSHRLVELADAIEAGVVDYVENRE